MKKKKYVYEIWVDNKYHGFNETYQIEAYSFAEAKKKAIAKAKRESQKGFEASLIDKNEKY